MPAAAVTLSRLCAGTLRPRATLEGEMQPRTRLLAFTIGAALAVSACGGSDDSVEPDVSTSSSAVADADTGADSTAVDGVAEVPLVLELEVDEAIAEIESAGLVAEIVPLWVPPSDPRLGIVVVQSPEPFGWLPEGSVMKITVGE